MHAPDKVEFTAWRTLLYRSTAVSRPTVGAADPSRQVVLLASLDAKFRRDAQLAGPQICSVATDDALRDVARESGMPPFEASYCSEWLTAGCSNFVAVFNVASTLVQP